MVNLSFPFVPQHPGDAAYVLPSFSGALVGFWAQFLAILVLWVFVLLTRCSRVTLKDLGEAAAAK
jgi:hypothetical protein